MSQLRLYLISATVFDSKKICNWSGKNERLFGIKICISKIFQKKGRKCVRSKFSKIKFSIDCFKKRVSPRPRPTPGTPLYSTFTAVTDRVVRAWESTYYSLFISFIIFINSNLTSNKNETLWQNFWEVDSHALTTLSVRLLLLLHLNSRSIFKMFSFHFALFSAIKWTICLKNDFTYNFVYICDNLFSCVACMQLECTNGLTRR
jgi:hypothetical protein